MYKTFTYEELTRFFAAINMHRKTNKRNYVMTKIMLCAGLRVSEVCHLKLCDIKDDPPALQVWNSKRGKSRTVPIIGELHAVIGEYLDTYHDGKNIFAFYNCRNDPVSIRQLQTWTKRVGAKAGIDIKKCHPHTFRHTYATELAKAGVSPFVIKERLGHSSLKTVLHYVHMTAKLVAEEASLARLLAEAS